MKKLPLGNFLLSAQAGVACGIRDDSGIAQLRLNNLLTNGSVDFKGHIRIPLDQVPDEMLLCQGDVLFNNTNSVELVGKTVYFDGHSEKVTFSNHVTRLRVKTDELSPEYLALWLQHQWRSKVFEGICDRWIGQAAVQKGKLEALEIETPVLEDQRQIAARLKAQLTEVETARQAVLVQVREVSKLADSIVYDSIKNAAPIPQTLGNVLDEVKRGIGPNWKDYPVLGATRDGLAPAREQPGKQAPKYKPAFPGTVFYNPMRILIGSIAFVDENDTPGITSPDYVVLQGKDGVVDSRWFYHWLRSPLGEQCILSLARGAVRERMLFNRLAEGEIALPDFANQQKASAALKKLHPLRRAIAQQLAEIERLPQRLLAQAFNNLETTP